MPSTTSRAFVACCLVAFPALLPHQVFERALAGDAPPAAAPPDSAKPPAATTPDSAKPSAATDAAKPRAATDAAKPGAATDAAKPGAATETPAVVVDGNSAETLLGKSVQSAKGDDLGRIVDVIVDRNGMMRAAIIDFGGFLGVGSRKIAVDWHVLHFPADESMDKLIADLPRDQLRKAPIFKEGEPVVIMGRVSAAPPAATPSAPASSPGAPAAPAETGAPAPKP